MNLGLRKMQISSAAVPPKRTSPIQRRSAPALGASSRSPAGDACPCACACAGTPRLVVTRSRPTPREPLTSTVSPGEQQSWEQLGCRLRVWHLVPLARERARDLARERADRDQQLDAAARGVRADLAVQPRRLGPELEHVPQHRHPPRGRGGGEVVDRRAHGHRVGVVAVLDHAPPRDRAPRAARACSRSEPPGVPKGSARARSPRPRRRAGCVGCAPGRRTAAAAARARGRRSPRRHPRSARPARRRLPRRS